MNVNVCKCANAWVCSSSTVWAVLTSQCGKQPDGFQEAVAASARPSSITAAGAVGLSVTLRGTRAFNDWGLRSHSRSPHLLYYARCIALVRWSLIYSLSLFLVVVVCFSDPAFIRKLDSMSADDGCLFMHTRCTLGCLWYCIIKAAHFCLARV